MPRTHQKQWHAFIASWLGWTLDAFDFTAFLFLLIRIAKAFSASRTLVVLVGSMTMWMCFAGATVAQMAGWVAGPNVVYTTVPMKVMDFAAFPHKVGRLKRQPDRWADIFFEEGQEVAGS